MHLLLSPPLLNLFAKVAFSFFVPSEQVLPVLKRATSLVTGHRVSDLTAHIPSFVMDAGTALRFWLVLATVMSQTVIYVMSLHILARMCSVDPQ